MIFHEDNEARWLWQWASMQPIVKDSFFAIPNGGKRNKREAARLRSMGVRPGVSDYFLSVPRGIYHGLYIELKAMPPHHATLTQLQRAWIVLQKTNGYHAAECRGWNIAAELITAYMGLEEGEGFD